MNNLRRWEIDAAVPFHFQLAADARFSRTDYLNDQVWTLQLATRDEAALALQTRFGGRAEEVRIAPRWEIDGRVIADYHSYAKPPLLTHFAPGFLCAEASLLPELDLCARYWAMESQAVGGEFRLINRSDRDLPLQLELFGRVIIKGRRRKLNVLSFRDDSVALHLGQIADINPVLTLHDADLRVYGGHISSPKLGCRLQIPAGETLRIPFVVAGLGEMRDSLSLAMNWLSRPWQPFFEQIDRAARAVPKISTGQPAWDRLIDLSYSLLLSAMLKPTAQLPHPSFVANRAIHRGWSRRGDGRDHIRAWSGQDPTLAYLMVPALAGIQADFAKGIIRNYLAAQDESGAVDRQPGLAGQRQGLLMMPLLARLAWMIHQQNDDRAFIAETFAGLRAFFESWFTAERDADGDGAPEWQSERQMGYIAFPTFGGQAWAQGAAIRQIESPDLLAYLISEAEALHEMARLLGESDAEEFAQKRQALEAKLAEFWDGARYVYRDRDTHQSQAAIELLRAAPADESHRIQQRLPHPARLLIRVAGGISQRPPMRLRLTGRDAAGKVCRLEAGTEQFDWYGHQGIYTSEQVLSAVDSIAISGLSRVYKIDVRTVDSSRLDISHLIPLWGGRIPPANAAALAAVALDERHFMRPNGLTMVSAADSRFDPSNARGGGGIWMYWLSLIGEGLVKHGCHQEAAQLVKRLLARLSSLLEREGCLSQFYDADALKGYGEDHHIGGIVPLHLLSEVLGIRISAPDKVWVGGDFSWGAPITIEQHGVRATRSEREIRIEFPSGHCETLSPPAAWQAVIDSSAPQVPAAPDSPPSPRRPAAPQRVVIELTDDAPAPPDDAAPSDADSQPASGDDLTPPADDD